MRTTIPVAARLLALGILASGALACGDVEDMCLPPARADGSHETFMVGEDGQAFDWYCEGSPPAELLDGTYGSDLIWVEGEACDPCDRERIAARAVTQLCGGSDPPLRLLCGPVPRSFNPWDPKGCVYAVASRPVCVY